MRAYSIVSPSWEEHLEFLSVKVPEGQLTSRLQHIRPGDHIFLGRKPTGTLVADALTPGAHLFLLGTGTGLAPFLSILMDPDTHERFERVTITHTVRAQEELAYRDFLERDIRDHPYIGELIRDRFNYYPTVTQEEFHTHGRITDRIRDGSFARDLRLDVDRFDVRDARAMVCGSIAFNHEACAILEGYGLEEGTQNRPGSYVVERAFVG